MWRWYLIPLLMGCFSLRAQETVYALMITGKAPVREHFALIAMQNFKEQTYPNKHLIIINHGHYPLKVDNDPEITEVTLIERGLTAGELRNRALNLIPEGSPWVQWDDDDYRHPLYMEELYEKMQDTQADAVFIMNYIRWYLLSCVALEIHAPDGYAGMVIARKRKEFQYEPLNRGETTQMQEFYKTHFRTACWDNPPWYYVYCIHKNNLTRQRLMPRYKKHHWHLDRLSQGSIELFSQMLSRYSAILPWMFLPLQNTDNL